MYRYTTRVGYVYEKQAFVALVCDEQAQEILSLGLLPTEHDAFIWGRKVIDARAWETQSEPPDLCG